MNWVVPTTNPRRPALKIDVEWVGAWEPPLMCDGLMLDPLSQATITRATSEAHQFLSKQPWAVRTHYNNFLVSQHQLRVIVAPFGWPPEGATLEEPPLIEGESLFGAVFMACLHRVFAGVAQPVRADEPSYTVAVTGGFGNERAESLEKKHDNAKAVGAERFFYNSVTPPTDTEWTRPFASAAELKALLRNLYEESSNDQIWRLQLRRGDWIWRGRARAWLMGLALAAVAIAAGVLALTSLRGARRPEQTTLPRPPILDVDPPRLKPPTMLAATLPPTLLPVAPEERRPRPTRPPPRPSVASVAPVLEPTACQRFEQMLAGKVEKLCARCKQDPTACSSETYLALQRISNNGKMFARDLASLFAYAGEDACSGGVIAVDACKP